MYKIKEYKIRGKEHLNYKNLEEALKAMAALEGYGREKQVYKYKDFDIKMNIDGEDFQTPLFFVNIKDGLEGIRRGHYILNKDLRNFLEEEREKCIEKYMEIKQGNAFIDIDSKKLFVGGYYDERIFKGKQFEGKTPFSKNIALYTLSEVLKLPFIENVCEWYLETYEKDWDKTTEKERIEAIMEYNSSDEISGLEYFNTVEEAEKYKNEVLEEIKFAEDNSVYNGKIQDRYGYFREVYVHKDDLEKFRGNKDERNREVKQEIKFKLK